MPLEKNHRHILSPSAYFDAIAHRGLYLFIFSFYLIIPFFIWLRFQMDFCVIRHTQNYQKKNNPQNILYDDIKVNILVKWLLSL